MNIMPYGRKLKTREPVRKLGKEPKPYNTLIHTVQCLVKQKLGEVHGISNKSGLELIAERSPIVYTQYN